MEKNPATVPALLPVQNLWRRPCRSTDDGRRDAELVDSGRYYIEKALTLKTFREVASFALVIHTAGT